MKKKIFLALVMAFAFALTLAFTVSADSIHNENTVDYSATVTLGNGTVLPLFDENKEALTWYLDSSNQLQSIRTDDQRIKWNTETWNEVTGVSIVLNESTTIRKDKLVVVNMMDDDVVNNAGAGTTHYGKPITMFKFLFNYSNTLEYVYLRLDTTNIQKESFIGCKNLKYVNLESLTKLVRIGDSNNFAGCTSLFEGQIVDLSNTSLQKIDWGGCFKDVPMAGIILPSSVTLLCENSFKGTGLVTISFPEKMTLIEKTMFENCVSLTTVCLNNKIKTIKDYAFNGCTALNTVFFVGTLDELNTMLTGVSTTGNDAFLEVAKNIISYQDYLKLSDKSGKYMVYGYSWCEGYNKGNHEVTGVNPCVGLCSVCNNNIAKHVDGEELFVSIEYADFTKSGVKSYTCVNEGCTYCVTEETPVIFTCVGFSKTEIGKGGIVLGYTVNGEAIKTYTEITGKTLIYGVFAVSEAKLGDNDIFTSEGASDGVLHSVIHRHDFDAFDLKIVGFNDENKDKNLILGAYVKLSNEETTEYKYIQYGEAKENAKYWGASFSDIAKITSEAE